MMTPHDRADWRAVNKLYSQFSAVVNQRLQTISPDITSALANQLGRVLAHYDAAEPQFCDDLMMVVGTIDQGHLPEREDEKFFELYTDGRLDAYPEYQLSAERRRPKPFEASIETCRRLICLNNIQKSLRRLGTGAILGGSASYGRFYNVAGIPPGAHKSSDADVLLVIPNYGHLPSIATALENVAGVYSKSLKALQGRVAGFQDFARTQAYSIFSHKLIFWKDSSDPLLKSTKIPGEFAVSLHIFSSEVFDYLILKDLPILEAPDGRFERMLSDYRDSAPGDVRTYNQRSFSSQEFSGHPLNPREVPDGYITDVQVCLIQEERYCPGLHQNLILPQFEVRWASDEMPLRLRVLSFRWKILERLRHERTLRPFEHQNLVQSHLRYYVFAPHVVNRANRE
jgi:hypothetical protein